MSTYTIDFDAMLAQLRSNLEVDSADDYHTDTDLKRYINLGIIEMARRTKVVQAVKFLYLSAGVARYSVPTDSLRGQIDQVLFLKSGSLSGSQYQLKKLDRRGFQSIKSACNSGILSTIAYQKPGSGAPLYYLLDGDVIEFEPVPSSAYAGANMVCVKAPGIPDQLSATSAVPDIPLEHRMVPVKYATYLGWTKDKDPRADGMLRDFLVDCEQIEADTKWTAQEDPPVILPERYFHSSEWSIK